MHIALTIVMQNFLHIFRLAHSPVIRYTRVMALEPTDPNYVPSGSYPAPEGSGPSAAANNYGYPFQVSGPTAPADDPQWSPPREFMDPQVLRTFEPHYQRRRPTGPRMPNDPFKSIVDKHETEFGFAGMHPDPVLDYSGGGSISRIPIADPDPMTQQLHLRMARRTDVANPGDWPNPYVAGNPDRFGAQPPLVRRRGRFRPSKYRPPVPPRMQREW